MNIIHSRFDYVIQCYVISKHVYFIIRGKCCCCVIDLAHKRQLTMDQAQSLVEHQRGQTGCWRCTHRHTQTVISLPGSYESPIEVGVNTNVIVRTAGIACGQTHVCACTHTHTHIMHTQNNYCNPRCAYMLGVNHPDGKQN